MDNLVHRFFFCNVRAGIGHLKSVIKHFDLRDLQVKKFQFQWKEFQLLAKYHMVW